MANYTVRLLGKTIVHKETKSNYHEPVVIISFAVKELGYSDSVELAKAEFTKKKAKALVKEKIKLFLAKQTGQEEYQVTI